MPYSLLPTSHPCNQSIYPLCPNPPLRQAYFHIPVSYRKKGGVHKREHGLDMFHRFKNQWTEKSYSLVRGSYQEDNRCANSEPRRAVWKYVEGILVLNFKKPLHVRWNPLWPQMVVRLFVLRHISIKSSVSSQFTSILLEKSKKYKTNLKYKLLDTVMWFHTMHFHLISTCPIRPRHDSENKWKRYNRKVRSWKLHVLCERTKRYRAKPLR